MGLISDTKQAIQDSPKGIFNWYVLVCTCIFAFPGVAKGFDEGMYGLPAHEMVNI
jgi:hypothetical protein